MTESVYNRFMLVCNKSGIRGLGLEKRILETRNFLNVLYKIDHEYGVFHEMEWIVNDVKKIHEFFKLIDICCFRKMESRYVEDVIKVKDEPCVNKSIIIATLHVLLGSGGEILSEVQNRNRLHLIVIRSIPLLEKHIGFSESWIEDNELFFRDMKKALEEVFYFTKQTGDKIPWVGNDMREFELFNTNSFSQIKSVLRRTSQRKGFRFME